jgi:predicted nicotinamide N-methyase
VLSAHLDRMVALQAEGIPLVEAVIGSATYRKLQVIELGSGCGIVGISLAQLIPDCEVICSDLPEAQEIAQRNIDGMNPAISSTVVFQSLDWEGPLPQVVNDKVFDLILVADCTYNPDSSPALVDTFSNLVKRSPKSVILLSMKVRHQDELVFFDLMGKADFIGSSKISIPLPEMEGEPEYVDIHVFHHKDRPSYA